MTFYWPYLLWLLLVPAGLLTWELTRRRRAAAASGAHPKILRAEIGTHDVSLALGATTSSPTRVRPWLAFGLAFAIVALARPQWGRIEEPVFDQSREILIAMDLSRSMLSTDVKPSRLDRAKLLVQSLLEKLRGERVGLVVFSGTAFLQSPLSADYEILREFLPALGPNYLPEGGTNYRELIDTSLDAFGNSNAADRFLIILSDGEATDDEWQSRVGELKQRGIRVIGLGVGTIAGSMIPDGSGGFVKDDRGAVVLSKLESSTLEQLASATGGVYRDASTWVDLADLIQQTVAAGRAGKFVEKRSVRYIERFQWPLALALWCLLVSFYFEFPVRPRPRDLKLNPPGGGSRGPAGTAAKAGLPGSPPIAETTPPIDRPPASLARRYTAGAKVGLPLSTVAILLGVLLTVPIRGAVKIEPPAASSSPMAPTGSSGPSAPTPSPIPEAPPLAKIVGRLSNADDRSAQDWEEMAQETAAWGTRLQTDQKPVPAGPVRDALAAVELGSKLDPQITDWPKLRQELEDLLKKPEQQQKQQQEKKDQSQSEKNQQPQQNQSQSKKSDQSKDQAKDQPQPQRDQQNPSPTNQSSPAQDRKPEQGQPKPDQTNQSMFGDMKKQPPQPSSETQKVGGAREKKDQADATADPSLALPLEKMEQLHEQDSPAQLFELLQGDRNQTTRKKPAKNW